MTLDEKIQEAEFFLDLIRKNEPNVSIVKYYFSAFLGALGSIHDYILAEASQEYNLELSMDESWFDRHFEKKAKEQGNENALLFLKWWRKVTEVHKKTGAGQIIQNVRNMELHKTKQKPIFNILWWAIPPIEKQTLKKIPVTTDKNSDVESINDLDVSLELLKPEILKRENEYRTKNSQQPATDIIFTWSLQIPGLPNFGKLEDACETFVQMMKHDVEIARQIMEESKTGTPKI